MKKLKPILTKKEVEDLTLAYFKDEAKAASFEEMAKVDSLWDRVKMAQVRRLGNYLFALIEKERTRAVKKRNLYSGKTRKTATKLYYCVGRVDALTYIQLKLAAIILEVDNEDKQSKTPAKP